MSPSAEVVLRWADGEYLFALKMKQIEELQKLCGVGLGAIYARVITGEWYAGDLYHTVRLGLMGGGTPAVKAKELADLYIDGKALARLDDPSSPLKTAIAVLHAVIEGVQDLSTGKAEAATTEDGSTSRPSEPTS